MVSSWFLPMFGCNRKARFAAAACALGVLHCGSASPKENMSRSDREAISLFDQIMLHDKSYYTTCTISDKWLDYRVYAATARQYIKYSLRGDLSPPDHTTEPKDIIGKAAGVDALICSESEQSARKDAALSASTQSGGGTFRGRKIVASTSTTRREFSYPIFDTDYRTAFVVRNNSKRIWIKTEDDKYPSFGDGEIVVFVYRKRHGRWKAIGYDTYSTYQ